MELALITLLGIGILGAAWLATSIAARKTQLVDFVESHPSSAALAVFTVDAEGQVAADGASLFWNADRPMVLASTMKLMVLVAYAEAVATASLDPNEPVAILEWEKYYIPGTDGGAHAAGLRSLGQKHDGLGYALDQGTRIPLEGIARNMIHHSGNASTDYLINRLGATQLQKTLNRVGASNHSSITLLLGPSLVSVLASAGQALEPLIAAKLSFDLTSFEIGDERFGEELAQLYLNDPEWRGAVVKSLSSPRTLELPITEAWQRAMQFSRLFPSGTAREYAQVIAKAAAGKLISPGVSKIVTSFLESNLDDGLLRALFYKRYGAKDGLTAGVRSIASFARPKWGRMAKRDRVVVIILNDMPIDAWQQVARTTLDIYPLHLDLATAGGQFRRLQSKVADSD